jgi:Fumarate reductase flavoprotein C-term
MERPLSPFMLANLAEQAVVIAHSACARAESRGAHAREDYRKRDDVNWLKHTCAWKDENWTVTFAYRPVRLQALSNEVQSFPPAERTALMHQGECTDVRVYASRELQGRPGQALGASASGQAREEFPNLPLGPREKRQSDDGHVRHRSRQLRTDGP